MINTIYHIIPNEFSVIGDDRKNVICTVDLRETYKLIDLDVCDWIKSSAFGFLSFF